MVGNDNYDNNFNESNHSSNDVDVNDNDAHFYNDISDGCDSKDSGSIESANSNENSNDQIKLYYENEREKGAYLIKVLRIWALESDLLSMRKLDLLVKLKPLFLDIFLSYKILLDIPSNIQIIQINRDQLWYKSITANLNSMNLENYLKLHKRIVIDVNLDGYLFLKVSENTSGLFLIDLLVLKISPLSFH